MIKIHSLKALQDNYIYVVEDKSSGQIAVVDPGESESVIHFFESQSIRPHFIWNTHHHWDHVNGNRELKKRYDLKIFCSQRDFPRIEGADRGLEESDSFYLGDELVKILEIPGHTHGHIAFYLINSGSIFVGDTLFSLGCGRLFEGSAEDLYHSLMKLKTLPDFTEIYCGHEYTLKNWEFSYRTQPSDELLNAKIKIEDKLKTNASSLPTTLDFEKKYNLFLKATSVDEFTQLRLQRDQF